MHFTKILDPKNDVAFRKIFGTEKNKSILIGFINDIQDFQGQSKIVDVTIQNPILEGSIHHQKESIVDVLCKTKTGEEIIVEMQLSPQKGFEKRALYYASKAYSRQLKKGTAQGGKYTDLKSVIFIAILNNTIYKNKKDYISRHKIMDEKTYENDLKDFSFTFIELEKFPKKSISSLKTNIEKWCYFFKEVPESSYEDIREFITKAESLKQAFYALEEHNWSKSELLAYEKIEKEIRDNYAIEEYKKDKYIEIGMEKGIASTQKSIAKNLLEKGMSSDQVAEITGLSLHDIEEIFSKN